MGERAEGALGALGCGASGLLGGLGVVLLVVSGALLSFTLACHGAGAEWGATDHTIGVGVLLGLVLDLGILLVGVIGAAAGVGAIVLLVSSVMGGALGAGLVERLGRARRPPDDGR